MAGWCARVFIEKLNCELCEPCENNTKMFFIVHYMIGRLVLSQLPDVKRIQLVLGHLSSYFSHSKRIVASHYDCANAFGLTAAACWVYRQAREGKNTKYTNDLQWCKPRTDYRLPAQIVGHERNVIDHHNFTCGSGDSLHMRVNRRCAVCAADAHIEPNNTHLV